MAGFRTSDSCNLDPHHPLIARIEARVTRLTGIDPAHGETIQGQRYAPGQCFKPHHDYFFTDQPYWPEQDRRGGQRTWTVMVFLDEPAVGGETDFPDAGIRIAPRTGTLLAWDNLQAYGKPNLLTLHQGLPVDAGIKHVITKWYRTRAWS